MIIERAKGILMERHGADERRAFELLRDNARSNSRRVVEVAQAVVDGHALLPRTAAGVSPPGPGIPVPMTSGDPRPGPSIAPDDFKRAFERFQKDQMSDRAAALTYYSLLSLFPALLFGVAALGYFGRSALIADAADYLLQAGAPRQTVDAVTKALESAQSQRSTAFTALILALGTSLYGASGAFGAVGRALNVVWRVEEGRSFIRKKLYDLAWTAALLVLVTIPSC